MYFSRFLRQGPDACSRLGRHEEGAALIEKTLAERRSGGRIRVTAQLIEVSGETQLWAERYDREMLDVFDIQD